MPKDQKPSYIKSKKGQMAIFVAIVFQVLFVLFAMSINVALVVHDKVNLQNATDLAAYYAAQKQAELLNVIAHQNYQIRQSWKLLTWRYRFLGQYGIGGSDASFAPHPARPRASLTDEEFFVPNPAASNNFHRRAPSVCMGYGPQWEHASGSQNLCKSRNFRVPQIPIVTVVPGLTAIFQTLVTNQIKSSYSVIGRDCDKMTAYNFLFGASIMLQFRLDQKNRREVIFGLANNLSNSRDEFIDLNGESVRDGVTQMVNKNLTYANRDGGPQVELFNSLGGLSAGEWLSDQLILPALLYSTPPRDGSGGATPCFRPAVAAYISDPPEGGAKTIVDGFDSQGMLRQFSAEGVVEENKIYQYSMGVEKNPWKWVYAAVRSTTTTRPLFFPFGEPLTITAKSFAKPFGGRIGPWYNTIWSPSANSSSGREKTDVLLAPRVNPAGGADLATIRNDQNRLPNYGRFPGDQKGLTTNLSLNSLRGAGDFRGENMTNYIEGLKRYLSGDEDDLTFYNYRRDQKSTVGELEVAAIVPDLFDITYYSIDPHFSRVYLDRLRAHQSKLIVAGPQIADVSRVRIRGDLGSKQSDQDYFGIYDQIKISKQKKREEAFYFIKEKAHLLTAWLHGETALDFDVDSGNAKNWFAKCGEGGFDHDGKRPYKVPGDCVLKGGRTGYSVKLFSRDIFSEDSLALGGRGVTGRIQNPPPNNF